MEDPFASTRRISLSGVPIAGVGQKYDKTTAQECMKLLPAREIPQNVQKYRRSGIPVGSRALHPGLVDDFKSGEHLNKLFGKAGIEEDSSWRTQRASELQEQMMASREQIYATQKREPLGKSFSRGVKLPETDDPRGLTFGKVDKNDFIDNRGGLHAKQALYPSTESSDEAFREQYIKSHHAYDVGQQKSRSYQWPQSVQSNAQNHVFGVGVGSHKAMNNSSKNVQQQFQPTEKPSVVVDRVESVQGLRDQLGKCRNLLQNRDVDPNRVYGRSDRRNEDWDARACIEGDYSYEEQTPDYDLGCSITPGFRKDSTLLLEGRLAQHAFGVPSVRSDLGKKNFRSIADSNNYGDDVTAAYLLYPPNSNSLGVESDDFSAERGKQEILGIFSAVQGATNETMEAAWELAAVHRGQASCTALSILEFRAAFNQIMEGRKLIR